ncbi:MAG: hypothetical protein AAB374_00375 [Patescibacteria group bacterium]
MMRAQISAAGSLDRQQIRLVSKYILSEISKLKDGLAGIVSDQPKRTKNQDSKKPRPQ